jgi:hypothetical protein
LHDRITGVYALAHVLAADETPAPQRQRIITAAPRLVRRRLVAWRWAVCLGSLAAVAGPVAQASNTSKIVIGSTSTAVAANAPNLIATNLTHWSATRLATLSNFEMAAIYYHSPQAYAIVYSISATQGTRMKYVSRIGGTTYAPPTVGVDSTLEEIYLDFRTAPAGALGPSAALYETAVYAMQNLAVAWGVGYTIGTGIHWLIERYDPALDNLIGYGLDTLLTKIAEYPTSGYWQFELNMEEFGVPFYDLSNGVDWGSWGVLDDAATLFDSGGFCLNPGEC